MRRWRVGNMKSMRSLCCNWIITVFELCSQFSIHLDIRRHVLDDLAYLSRPVEIKIFCSKLKTHVWELSTLHFFLMFLSNSRRLLLPFRYNWLHSHGICLVSNAGTFRSDFSSGRNGTVVGEEHLQQHLLLDQRHQLQRWTVLLSYLSSFWDSRLLLSPMLTFHKFLEFENHSHLSNKRLQNSNPKLFFNVWNVKDTLELLRNYIKMNNM